jgi:hypothetical protein
MLSNIEADFVEVQTFGCINFSPNRKQFSCYLNLTHSCTLDVADPQAMGFGLSCLFDCVLYIYIYIFLCKGKNTQYFKRSDIATTKIQLSPIL